VNGFDTTLVIECNRMRRIPVFEDHFAQEVSGFLPTFNRIPS
jgi:hypothetical protein